MIETLAKAFGSRLMVKETGCGMSPGVARRLRDCGVRTLDISGLGGTSWIRVEQLRAQGVAAEAGEVLSGWGIPTAASVAAVRHAVGQDAILIASGGIRTGLDIAKAIRLGADVGGLALPLFRALEQGGQPAVREVLEALIAALKQTFLLTGSRDSRELRRQPVVIAAPLRDWLDTLSTT